MRQNSCKILAVAALALIGLTAAAEAQRSRREPPRPRPPSRAEVETYMRFPVGERLTVVSINGARPAAPDRPIFTFTTGLRMTGFGGCNPVNADYRRGVDDIRFGPLNFVERRCGGEIDRQERAIFWAIQGATRWRAVGQRGMTFTGRRGTVTFARAF
ncbi:MAG: META domain-containing protein [Phreatobacter sp.]